MPRSVFEDLCAHWGRPLLLMLMRILLALFATGQAKISWCADCYADALIVQTKDANNNLHPLKNDAELVLDEVLEPDKEGKYRVYVEAAAGFESTCILLDPKSGAPLPPDAPAELHQIFAVVSEEQQQKDQRANEEDYASPAYVVTPQTKDLLDLFFDKSTNLLPLEDFASCVHCWHSGGSGKKLRGQNS